MKLVTGDLFITVFSALILVLESARMKPKMTGTILRSNHDALLYEDFSSDSNTIRFTMAYGYGEGGGWDDLDSLMQKFYFEQRAMFCTMGTGVWLLYPDKSYKITSRPAVKLLYGDVCTPVDNVNSLRPVGSYRMNSSDNTAGSGFGEKNFEGEMVKFGQTGVPIKSAVLIGDGNWTITTQDNRKICVSTVGMEGKDDVCLLEDIEGMFESPGAMIERECDDDDENMEFYGLQKCFDMGYHELTYEMDFTPTNMEQICSGSYDENDPVKHKFLQTLRIWQLRLGENDYSVPDPPTGTLGKISLDIVGVVKDIMEASCGEFEDTDEDDDDYLNILEWIFTTVHLKNGEIWSPEPNGTTWAKSRQLLGDTAMFLEHCLTKVRDQATIKLKCPEASEPFVGDPQAKKFIEDFLNGDSYDFVIEQFYLIFSYVSSFCYNTVGIMDNTWGELPLILKGRFLYPLREQWKNPGQWTNIYPLMFHGFDLEVQRKRMIRCLQEVIKQTPLFDPIARPPEFEKNVTAVGIGKGKDKDGDGDKTKGKDGRRKRQWRKSDESYDENDLGDGSKNDEDDLGDERKIDEDDLQDGRKNSEGVTLPREGRVTPSTVSTKTTRTAPRHTTTTTTTTTTTAVPSRSPARLKSKVMPQKVRPRTGSVAEVPSSTVVVTAAPETTTTASTTKTPSPPTTVVPDSETEDSDKKEVKQEVSKKHKKKKRGKHSKRGNKKRNKKRSKLFRKGLGKEESSKNKEGSGEQKETKND